MGNACLFGLGVGTSAIATTTALATAQGPPTPRGALLVVHTNELSAVAEAWRDWRSAQGWTVALSPIQGETTEVLRARIREWAASAGESPRAVLLLGGVPAPTHGIATFRFKQRDPSIRDRRDDSFSSDGPYQDIDDDGVPDLMLGRVPVSTVADATRVLDKIRAWESAPPTEAHRRVELVGGEGRFGPYDSLLEVLTSSLLIDSVPPEFELRATYAKASSPFCPPPSRVGEIVRMQALSGALLFNYVGHGHATGLDSLWWRGGRERLLEVKDLEPSPASAREGDATAPSSLRPGGVALLVCCSAGWYDDPAQRSLAEALLVDPAGPIAVFAGSRPTHPYANAIVERDGVRVLLRDRVPTVGAWDLAISRSLASGGLEELDLIATPIALAQRWPLTLRTMRRDHALLYNLIGDPTTALIHAPSADTIELSLASPTRLIGTLRAPSSAAPSSVAPSSAAPESGAPQSVAPLVAGAVDGTTDVSPQLLAEVRLTVRRTATPPGVIAASGPDDPRLEEHTTRNWVKANDWVRWRGEAPIVDGRFEIDMPDALNPSGEQIVVIVRRMDDQQTGKGADATLVAMTSRDRSLLLRSLRHEQGLPPARRAAPH